MNTNDTSGVLDENASDTTKNSQENSTTTDDRALAPEVLAIVEKFDGLSPEKQLETLKNLEGPTARKAQREAAAVLREMYSFSEPQTKKDDESDLETELAQVRKLKSELEELKKETVSRKEATEKEQTIRNYLETHGIDASIDDVLGDRNFVKNFLENKDLPMSKRVKVSMVDTYGGNTEWLVNRKNTTAITRGSSTSPSKSLSIKEKGQMDSKAWAKMAGL